MADQRIVSFIQSALKKGNSQNQIEQVLLQKGWKQEQVSEAFAAAASSGSSSVQAIKNPIATKKTLFIILGAVFLLAILGIAYTFIPDSPDVECSSDSDCSRGYSCDSGDCVLEEEIVVTDDDTSFVEEAECNLDSDCDDGFACSLSGNCYDSCTSTSGCADDYECDAGACVVVEESNESKSEGEVNYKIYSVSFDSLSFSPTRDVNMTALNYKYNISNIGNANSSSFFNVACILSFENGTEMGRNYMKLSGYDFDVGESGLYSCSGNSTGLYYTVQSLGIVNVSMNVTVDYYNNVSESIESDNSYVLTHSVAFANYSVTGSTVCTSTGSECSAYTCARNSYCYNVCTSLGGECASGYSCSAGACVAVSVVEDCGNSKDDDGDTFIDCKDSDCASACVAVGTQSTCNDVLPTCADGVDNDVDDLIDIADPECGDWGDEELGGYTCADTDSEEGDPYLVRGTLTLTSSSGTETVFEDDCSKDTLGEYSCDDTGDNDYLSVLINCATDYGYTYTCEWGACVTKEDCGDEIDNDGDGDVNCDDSDCEGDSDCVGSCSDSDSSAEDANLSQGTVTVVSSEGTETGTDSCDSNNLIEYSCAEDNTLSYETISCSTVYGSTASCSNGECVLPSSGDAASVPEVAACADAVDNDVDGKYDYLGACDTDNDGVIDYSCSVFLEEQNVAKDSMTGVYCKTACENNNGGGGVYYFADTQCSDAEDDSETLKVTSSTAKVKSLIKLSLAPEGEQNLLEKIWNFFFVSEAVDDRFLDQSYLRK
ncbi:MAG: hypothetical protein Q8R18_01755 [bacterium]|nr:hypothetical protein [bacterium]